MSVPESNGSLTAVAGRDINLKVSSTSADNATLIAQRDVNLPTVHDRAEVKRDNAIGSTVQGKEISITADGRHLIATSLGALGREDGGYGQYP